MPITARLYRIVQRIIAAKIEKIDLAGPTPLIVHVNPTVSEVMRLVQKHKNLRYCVDGRDIYWWDGYVATHENVADGLGIPYVYGNGAEMSQVTGKGKTILLRVISKGHRLLKALAKRDDVIASGQSSIK